MSTDFLERLYWALTDEEQHQKTGLDLGELYERTPAVKRADHAFQERMADFQPRGILLGLRAAGLYQRFPPGHEAGRGTEG